MTNEELIYKIFTSGDTSIEVALIAVVELHKPYQHEIVDYVFCKGCTMDLDLAPPYPCETIQAIEKVLV